MKRAKEDDGHDDDDEEERKRRPPPVEGRCSFWLKNRRRYCHMQRTRGSEFCSEHTPSPTRIPCPLDPHHTVDSTKLEKHLKRCPGTRLQKSCELPCFKLDANLGDPIDCPGDGDPAAVAAAAAAGGGTKETATTASEKELEVVLAKVRAAFPASERVAPAPLEQLQCAKCDEADPLCSAKHGKQHSSLVAHMLAANMIRGGGGDRSALVEMGAGRGRLSYVVSRCCPDGASRILLVDRGRFRHAVEHARQQPALGDDFRRVLIDIKDLDLAKAPLCETATHVCCFGKHLCGAACDMALRCAVAWAKQPNTTRECSIAIALCCFHRTEWRSYVGKDCLAANGSFTRADFDILRTITSWNTGSRTADGPSNPEKQQIGRMARHVLVAGRVAFLREAGFDVRVVQYVDEAISPENLLLLASFPRASATAPETKAEQAPQP